MQYKYKISEQMVATSNKAEHFGQIKRNYQCIILSSDIWMKLKDMWCALNILIILCLWHHCAHLLFWVLSSATHFCLTVECLVALFHITDTQVNALGFEVLCVCCGVFAVLAKVMYFVEVKQLLSLPYCERSHCSH